MSDGIQSVEKAIALPGSTGDVIRKFQGGFGGSFRPIEEAGVMEVFDSAAALDADVPTVLTLNNGTNIRMVTIKFLDAVTAGAYTVVSTAEHLYVAFAGTPFNDTQVAGARRVIGLNEERTFLFSDDMPATGISYAPHADSAINLQHVVVEVVYA